MTQSQWTTAAELAELLGCAVVTLNGRIARGQCPPADRRIATMRLWSAASVKKAVKMARDIKIGRPAKS